MSLQTKKKKVRSIFLKTFGWHSCFLGPLLRKERAHVRVHVRAHVRAHVEGLAGYNEKKAEGLKRKKGSKLFIETRLYIKCHESSYEMGARQCYLFF